MTSYAAGLDFGTSGARISVIDQDEAVVAHHQVPYRTKAGLAEVDSWRLALEQCLQALTDEIRQGIKKIALNGTSSTVLLCDHQGVPLTEPLLYNDARGHTYGAQLQDLAPAGSPVLSATSSLAKLLWWQHTLPSATLQSPCYLLHQADWLGFLLHGTLGLSDYHNALKLGYDVHQLTYPDWLMDLQLQPVLPEVQAPGTSLGTLTAAASDRYRLPADCRVIAGTTDSIAAFLASGAHTPGEAVTSLGSTLVIKLLSQQRIDAAQYGIYSHRLGDLWLVGGASNTGGNVLKNFFTDTELRVLSSQIASDRPSDLDYYPLLKPGERFPISDPALAPRLEPRPEEPQKFLQGMLEGIARIEAEGYHLLQTLGATPLKRLFSAGGGAQNPAWTAIRQRFLSVPIETPRSTEAAFGTARLALKGEEAYGTLAHHQNNKKER